MRPGSAAILVSVALHVVIVSWKVHRPRSSSVAPVSAPVSAPAAPEVPLFEPVEVVLFEYRAPTSASVAGDVSPPVRSRSTHAREPAGTGAVSTDAGTVPFGVEVPGPEPAAEPRPRGAPMPLSSQMIEDFLGRSRPLPPAPDLPGERVADEIADARRRIRDARGNPDVQMRERIKLVELYDQRDAEELRPAGGGTYKADKGAFTARVAADGTVTLDDKPNLQFHGTSLSFDVTDWAMRSHGDDPYSSAKREFLDRTRDQRVEIGKRHRKRQLARSAELAQRNVDRLLATTTEVAERKRGLFELWDECAETGDGDDDLARGGGAARDLILGVIRAQLRGDRAYTADELAELNRTRQSKAVFAPYD